MAKGLIISGLMRVVAALVVVITGVSLSACGGTHSSLPPVVTNSSPLHNGTAKSTAVGTDVVAINAGGGASGTFSADKYFATGTAWDYSVTNAINTSAVTTTVAPQAVYQSQRTGSSLTYTIPGLTPGASYNVILSFAELWFTAAKQRVFNVSINNTSVLSNFDIFLNAGARFKAISETFPTTASATGTITIVLTAKTDNAVINAIEIAPVATVAPTTTGLYIDAGGAATGNFVADEYFNANGSWPYAVSGAISTAGVTNPAPQAVYQSARDGASLTYTIPGLTAGTAYTVRLDFAELWWTAAGQRIFNVSINNSAVLTNFDIVAAAGGPMKAVSESFTATASSTGTITIGMSSVKDSANVNGIEITSSTATPTPTPTPAVTFNDYTTFGYDNARDVYNPNTTAFTPASLANLHLAWQQTSVDYNTQTQPILATEVPGHSGVLFVGGGSGKVYAYDAVSGAPMWTYATGQEQYSCENGYSAVFGIGGSAAYDPVTKSIYIVGNSNTGSNVPSTNTLYRLDAATGTLLGQVAFATPNAAWPSLDFAHTAVTLGPNGLAYVGTGATCDISSWRGRVVAINVPAMTVANTFFTAWNGTTQPWGGGGVWGWGGVSLDASGNVYTGAGNTDNGTTTHGSILAPFAAAPYEYSAYGDAFIKLSNNLATVEDSNHPIPASSFSGVSVDLDLNGTPVIFQPNGTGCDPLAAAQGKSGALYIYDTTRVGSGPIARYQLAPSTYADGFLGGPAYSAATGLLYVDVPSSNSSLFPPGMIAINPGCGNPSVVWNTAFGPDSYSPGSSISPGVPRSVPAVSAGGVVFVGTPCTPSGNTCSATTTSSEMRRAAAARRIPLICCTPAGTGGGAVWALNASTGAVLNGGTPVIITASTLRVPPTIDGNWLFVMDNQGDLYGLTIDPTVPTATSRARAKPR